MKTLLNHCGLIFLILMATACSASINDYKDKSPEFDLFKFFEGKTKAWGMVQDYSGKQIKRFEVELLGTVNDNELVLEEFFVYDDGEKQTRTWTIVKEGELYIGSASDVIGKAVGKTQGNVLSWEYVLRVETKDGEIDLRLEDWMYLQDENHMFNLATMKKFGIEVGKITLFFQRYEALSPTKVKASEMSSSFFNAKEDWALQESRHVAASHSFCCDESQDVKIYSF